MRQPLFLCTFLAPIILLACVSTDKAAEGDSGEWIEPLVDLDGDGFTEAEDCNDTLAYVFPGALEVCDGLDNDCNGLVDEDVSSTGYLDVDGDGFGDSDTALDLCNLTDGMTWSGGDCDDEDLAVHPAAEEICDGIDNNCNDEIDEGLETAWYTDVDSDGYGDDELVSWACEAPAGTIDIGGDCNDSADTAWPGATEICDEIDNDCDESIDENVTLTWYQDLDGDGYGQNSFVTEACTQPVGYSTVAGDCDDEDATAFPGSIEYCDEIDNDCDGSTDESDAADVLNWYQDSDGDGYGLEWSMQSACTIPSGYVASSGLFDCDDSSADAYPGAPEYCDSEDTDCDGVIDESDSLDATEWFPDADFDTYGEDGYSIFECTHPPGYASNNQDCNDGDATINPGQNEVCNGSDDDCDGDIDDDDPSIVDMVTWYSDFDEDGFGSEDRTMDACEQPSLYIDIAFDCDDGDSESYPGASEVCDLVDNNCNETVDEGTLGTGAVCPAETCLDILIDSPGATTGTYWLNIGQTDCDMDVDGGGWTLAKDFAPLQSLTYVENIYNEEELEWEDVWFEYNFGTLIADCAYPTDMLSCNPLVFKFGSENWAYPDNSGGDDCGIVFDSYASDTFYPSSDTNDFAITRSVSTDTIQVGTLEGVADCSLSDNTGIAHVKVWVR